MLSRSVAAGRRRIVSSLIIAIALFGTAAVLAPAAGATQGTQEPWTPSQAPMPATLPNGGIPQTVRLNATSCLSSAFCVAVGNVTDQNLNAFPLVETYSNGLWSPSILPTPPDAASTPDASLSSVSCPSDGVCAAVGTYYSYQSGSDAQEYQNGLLEVLSSGVWRPTEAPLPLGPDSGLVNLDSVSCSDPVTCVAVGNVSNYIGDPQDGLIYTLQSGSWQLQVANVSFAENLNLTLSGVSCPDDGACVVVGGYPGTYGLGYGLIMTLSFGSWTAVPAPLPSNVETGRDPKLGPVETLSSISCPELNMCVAGGYYGESNGNAEPLLMQLVSGVWTASQAPTPSDAASNPNGDIEGVNCPAVGACIATGSYFTNDVTAAESGMILTQANGTWIAADSKSSLAGVSCALDGFCAAEGADNGAGLLETGGITGLPAVTNVSPDSGPATGGSAVTVAGTNFAQGSVVNFGGVPAPTTFVSGTKLIVTAPPAPSPQPVDVSVTTGGLTSRASFADLFTYDFSTLTITNPSLPPGVKRVRYVATLGVGGGSPPYKWSKSSGSLPGGLQLKSTGVISGRPRAVGIFTFTVRVINHRLKKQPKESVTKTFSIRIT